MSLTIVMYHYVRDLERSRFPAVKARTLTDFRGQLDFIARHYEVVTAEQVIEAAGGGEALPERACWLTFDDGYLDHFTNVFPLLHERGWQGSFFAPAQTILEGELLDVNKIHFVLASVPDPETLIVSLRELLQEERSRGEDLLAWEEYWLASDQTCHLDSREVLFVKQMLQVVLPEAVRTRIVDRLFARFVSSDPRAFAAELYISADQLKLMVRSGMFVGSHGNGHYWLNSLPRSDQEREIDLSLRFLESIGMGRANWIMCYPYGAYNATTLEILASRHCAVGLTTRPGVADLAADPALELPRVDTIELPVG